MSRPNTLTEAQAQFVKNFTMGMTQGQAARNAGYKFPDIEATKLMRHPRIIAAIKSEREKYERKADMSREKVMKGLMETVEMAKLKEEPMAMVGAWREIARICGYYAPEQKKIDISINGRVHVNQITNMSDDELLKIIEGEAVREVDEPLLLESDESEQVG